MKTARFIIASACAAAVAISCQKDIEYTAATRDTRLIEAGFGEDEDATKLTIDDSFRKLKWELSDDITLFDHLATPVKATVKSLVNDGERAVFEAASYIELPYMALYPYRSESSIEGSSIYTTVPTTTTGSLEESCLSVGHVIYGSDGSGKISFKTAVGLFQFNVNSDAVKTIEVWGEGIAADIRISYPEGGPVSVYCERNVSSCIKLTGLEKGKDYFVAVVPQTYNELLIKSLDASNHVVDYVQYSGNIVVNSGDVIKWGDFSDLKEAPLPKGKTFKSAVSEAAGGVSRVAKISFRTHVKPTGKIINSGLGGAPVGLYYSAADSSITLSTPAPQYTFNEDCSQMFYALENLRIIDGTDNISTARTTDMTRMFALCSKLKTVVWSTLTTDNVTNMDHMFYNCSALDTVDVSRFKTDKVVNFNSMFQYCQHLKNLDLSTFNTGAAEDMSGMFGYTTRLATLKLGSSFAFASTTADIFKSAGSINAKPRTKFTCTSKQWIRIAELLPADDSYEWSNPPATASLQDGPTFNAAMKSLADGKLSNIKSINFVADSTAGKYKGTLINTGCSGAPVYGYFTSGTGEVVLYTAAADSFRANADCSQMFAEMTNLTKILNIGRYFATNYTTNMFMMFKNCKSLTTLNLVRGVSILKTSSFKTSNVTNMSYMFYNCQSLTSLDLSMFSTSKVTKFNSMFDSATSLKSITFGTNFKTANATTMSYMFAQCKSMTSLDVSTFDTSKVTDFSWMFSTMGALKTLKLGSAFSITCTSLNGMVHGLGCDYTTSPRASITGPSATLDILKSLVDDQSKYEWINL